MTLGTPQKRGREMVIARVETEIDHADFMKPSVKNRVVRSGDNVIVIGDALTRLELADATSRRNDDHTRYHIY
jgi:hypothetical protein